ncbi:MAG: peptidoglycan DD-metalloendopeptidase family protein [Balneolia bacterium]|nr:peptidoglycan DD-metalloendopeptidase family protein [Balneolia bacterium]
MNSLITFLLASFLLLSGGFGSENSESGTNTFTLSLSSPLNGSAEIIADFGNRTHPITGEERLHSGIDFEVNIGDPVHASAAGIVRFAGTKASFGKVVEITHEGGYVTRYAHLSGFSDSIEEGSVVEAGQQIGLAGESGHISSPVLHFELMKHGEHVDPAEYLN